MVALHEDSGSSSLECDICESGDPPVNRCTTCSHFLCEFCTQAHRDHKYSFVKDAFAKGKENLLKILSEAETKATSLMEAVAGVLEMKDNVNSYADETVQEVVECFTDLTTSLNTRCHQLVTEIGELKNSKLKSLEIQ